MKIKTLGLAGALLFSLGSAPQAQDIEAEISGNHPASGSTTPTQPAIRGAARNALLQQGVLLVPDSSNERVMAFDPEDGTLLDPDFIPSDSVALTTPKAVILSFDDSSFLIVDQIVNAVQQFDLDGNFIGTFAPAGGPDTTIMQNLRGLDYRPGTNHLVVTSSSGGNPNSVVEFDENGVFVGTFIDSGEGGLAGPWDTLFRDSDVLVSGNTNNTIYRFDLDGNFLDNFLVGPGFPQQVSAVGNGNVLIGNFSGTGTIAAGVIETDSTGEVVGVYSPVTSNRGAHELGNGNILTTNAGGVHEISRDGTLVETKTTDGGFQYISFVQFQGDDIELPETRPVPALGLTGLLLLALILAGVAVVVLRR